MKLESRKRLLVGRMISYLMLTALLAPAPAHARSNVGFVVAMLQNASAVMASASRCVFFTYDKNGNRLTQTTLSPPSSLPTWGSSSYGCFAWQN